MKFGTLLPPKVVICDPSSASNNGKFETLPRKYRTLYDMIAGDWIAVQRNDLENYPLEIKTDSVLGSEDQVMVYFYTSQGSEAGAVHLYFTSTPRFYLYGCSTGRGDFPATLPVAKDKIWRISLTKTSGIRLKIHCNDVMVLNYLLSNTACSDSSWSTIWNRDAEKMEFFPSDTASDYYKLSHQGDYNFII